MRIGLFAGTFRPFTIGHASIVDRALPLFDKVIIAIGVNAAKDNGYTDAAERRKAISALYKAEERVEVVEYSGELTTTLAKRLGAKWLIRGVRSVKDFEYERDIADINRLTAGIETIFLPALPELAAVSSSVVRELAQYGADVSNFLPK